MLGGAFSGRLCENGLAARILMSIAEKFESVVPRGQASEGRAES